jgi:small subunit ribosomal protein S8
MDTLNDMLTIVRNGLMVNKKEVAIPFSFFKERVLKLLKKEGYLNSVRKKKKEKREFLVVGLKYQDDQPAIKELTSISKPGRRIYAGYQELKPYKPYGGRGEGLGIVVVSTSQGLMTAREAKQKKLGGELLFKVF